MATNADLYGKIQPQPDITGKVLVGLMKKAWQVLAEADTVDNHANRLALAYKVICDPEPLAGKAWRLFLSNDTVQASIDNLASLSDNDIDWVTGDDESSKVYDRLANLEASV